MSRAWRLSGAVALAGVLVAAFNLRLGVVGVGPVLEDIRDDTAMSSALAGVLTTIPFVCMGGFALGGGRLIVALGRQHAITLGLLLIAAGTLLRAFMPTPLLLIAATIPIGLGIAIVNVAVAGVVKDRFPGRPGAATGSYVASLSIGAAAITGGIVPLAEALGGWREAFAVSAVPTLLALAVWLATQPGRPLPGEGGHAAATEGVRDLRPAVLCGLVFGFQSICYAAIVSWGPAVYIDQGWSDSRAGFITAVLPIVTVVAGLTVPALSDGRDRRPWVAPSALLQTIGMLGIAFAPTAAPLVWIVVFGFGNGSIFALSLTLPLDVAHDPDEAAWLTSWALGLGFLLSSMSPVLIGALRDVTGSFTLPMALIGTLGNATALAALMLPPPRVRAPAR